MKYPKNGQTNWIALNYNGFSLRDVIGNGTSQTTNVNATEWKKLLNNSDIQVKSKRSNILLWLCINFPRCSKTPVKNSKLTSVELLTYVLETTTATVAKKDRHMRTHTHTHTKKKAIKNRSGRSVNIQNTCFFRFIPRPFREDLFFLSRWRIN